MNLSFIFDLPRKFMETMGILVDKALPDLPEDEALIELGKKLQILAKGINTESPDDPRHCRTSLMLEELGELIEAMGLRDYVKVADALGDLLYVVGGTAVALGLNKVMPLVFAAIHTSNMTKVTTASRSQRILDKGPDYRPPSIEEILIRNAIIEGPSDESNVPERLEQRKSPTAGANTES